MKPIVLNVVWGENLWAWVGEKGLTNRHGDITTSVGIRPVRAEETITREKD